MKYLIAILLLIVTACACRQRYDTFQLDSDAGWYIKYANGDIEYFDHNKETGGFYKNGIKMIISFNNGKITYFPDEEAIK